MKYILKTEEPLFFTNHKRTLTKWNDYKSSKKRLLKNHILQNEQFQLCCYCEKKIHNDTECHVEHIKPKSLDLINLTFDYSNLIVSCEGNHFNEIGDNSKNTCGQKKENNFNEITFLNPTLSTDISEYFEYDSDTGIIKSSSKNPVRANYNISILNLNGDNNKLAEARKKAKDAFIKIASSLSQEQLINNVSSFLSDDKNEFITFFRFVFKGS
jgi:uncharacterized protein (TIGR02646 family)